MRASSQVRQPIRPSMRMHDQRRFQRISLNLLGRFMLENRREYPCQTQNISPGSAALVTPIEAPIGERIIAYIEQVGRIDGKVIRIFDGGFAMSIDASSRRRDKLAAKLTGLSNRHEMSLPEHRRHERISTMISSVAIKLPDGRTYQAQVIDLSLSGAALLFHALPPVGSSMTVGRLRAVVVRHVEGAVAVEFATYQTEESLQENLA